MAPRLTVSPNRQRFASSPEDYDRMTGRTPLTDLREGCPTMQQIDDTHHTIEQAAESFVWHGIIQHLEPEEIKETVNDCASCDQETACEFGAAVLRTIDDIFIS